MMIEAEALPETAYIEPPNWSMSDYSDRIMLLLKID